MSEEGFGRCNNLQHWLYWTGQWQCVSFRQKRKRKEMQAVVLERTVWYWMALGSLTGSCLGGYAPGLISETVTVSSGVTLWKAKEWKLSSSPGSQAPKRCLLHQQQSRHWSFVLFSWFGSSVSFGDQSFFFFSSNVSCCRHTAAALGFLCSLQLWLIQYIYCMCLL